MVDNRTNYARDISLMVYDTYSASIKVFETEIPMSVRASEVSVEGGSIYSYDPKGKAAFAYMALTKEVQRYVRNIIIMFQKCRNGTSETGRRFKWKTE